MKATARAHPIQGLVKYHGMRDHDARYPYHDSISVCTAPASTTTTVAFDDRLDADEYVIGGEDVTGRGAERVESVLDEVRERAGIDTRARLVSENDFPTNIGLGSSASGFAAAAVAACEAAGLDLSHPEMSTIARRGSASAARAVTGGYSDLGGGLSDAECRSHRLDAAERLEEDVRIVIAEVPAYKETQAAHDEAEESHMFDARRVHVEDQLAEMRDAVRNGDTERVFETAEHDSLSLAATTMTGPEGWVYWQPETLEVFETVRDLRADGVPAWFSTDTGATVYVNTDAEHAAAVEDAIAATGVDTRVWEVGGPARILDDGAALF
ncbi:phosphomevalonate decarboxylase [Halarchaeum solikamskense]|uniref:phosphomevalonate decarboxylase MvaD n=1 Tax=Halarchaeum nitratireducens TaxID=489913 RepID=UPI001B3B136E|nr:phosphomevalonate decarboxylase MvaD [Halarchaeum solikamskense]MBP2252181.1 phosphomevalonate decarboxylase [Halarchaeum solikamskense]